MGEMTIRIDDALALRLGEIAEERGVIPEVVAVELLENAVQQTPAVRMNVARAILARGVRSPIGAVDLLDEIRNGEP